MSDIRNKINLPINPEEYKTHSTKFLDWFVNAKARDRIIYYRGENLQENLSATYVQKTTFRYACEGKVYLYCMRDPDVKYSWLYMAEKASKRIHKLNPLPIER